jgi:uncharacterized protein YkwD
MRSSGIRTAIVVLTFGVFACGSATPTSPDEAIAAAAPSEVTVTLVELTNIERRRMDLPVLRANARLMDAAQIHAEQMVRFGKLGHVLPNGPYPRPQDRLAEVSYKWQAFAENVAYGHRSPSDTISGWMQSAGHRSNILNVSYTEIGTGYEKDANGRAYYVQVFGRPQ